jgi:choline dehydrogenase-like flavoprotein
MVLAQSSYDFVVVGAGTAGSVIAARLSEDNTARVLVLEAGGSTPLPEIAVPAAWPSLVDTGWNWGESTVVQSATGTTSALARGRGVGGASAINGMLFARGHRASYDAWEQAGAKDWNTTCLGSTTATTSSANQRKSRRECMTSSPITSRTPPALSAAAPVRSAERAAASFVARICRPD